jgi:hypothetical protein
VLGSTRQEPGGFSKLIFVNGCMGKVRKEALSASISTARSGKPPNGDPALCVDIR